jgi:putative ABC transport system permease protein
MLTRFLLVAAAVDAHPDQLVDTAWLAAHSKDANVRIVDVRRSGFDVGHIPGARWLDAGSVRDPGNTPSVLLSAAAFEHGIGASAAMFSLVNQILLHPRGVAEPGRILVVRTAYEHMNLSFDETSPHVFADMSAGRDVFEHVAAMRPASFNHRGRTNPCDFRRRRFPPNGSTCSGPVQCSVVSQTDEDEPGSDRVAVLAYSAWMSLFGGDVNISGRTIDLDEQPYRVIGVMRREFTEPAGTQI